MIDIWDHEPADRIEYQPGEWEPGDPLYHQGTTNIVRRIFDIIESAPSGIGLACEIGGNNYCERCDVSWHPKSNRCWNCGRFAGTI